MSFLCIDNDLTGKEIEKTVPLIEVSKIKYLGTNLTRDVKDLYSENDTTLMKEIEDETNNGKIIHAHGSEESVALKMSILPM
jgi:hypothetical protein